MVPKAPMSSSHKPTERPIGRLIMLQANFPLPPIASHRAWEGRMGRPYGRLWDGLGTKNTHRGDHYHYRVAIVYLYF